MDIMFYEAFDEEQEALKQHLPSDIKAQYTDKTIQEKGDTQPPAKIVSIRTQSTIPDNWSSQLDGILTRSAGYDHLKDCYQEVPCGYLVDYCSRAVAEQAMLATMMLLRKFKLQLKQLETFNRDNMTGLELIGRNLLVVGVGHIGSEVVDLAKGLKMNIKGVDIAPKIKDIDYVSLQEGLSWAEATVCALPLTETTHNLLNYDVLKDAKKGSVLTNIARGEITPIQDLERLLDESVLLGVALDVYPQEGIFAQELRAPSAQLSKDTKGVLAFSKRDNVLCTPHNAFNTQEAVERKAKESVEAVAEFLRTKSFPNPVVEA